MKIKVLGYVSIILTGIVGLIEMAIEDKREERLDELEAKLAELEARDEND